MVTINQLQNTLTITYGIVPVVAGLYKFKNWLTNRADYLVRHAGILPVDALLFRKILITGICDVVCVFHYIIAKYFTGNKLRRF